MPSDNDARYQEILRRIQARGRPAPASVSPIATILDSLNAYDQLNDVVVSLDETIFVFYGPRVFNGKGWQGVITWYHCKGYHGYRQLTLYGIWMFQEEADFIIGVGRKNLTYQAPVFVAEAYYKLIRRGFHTYYNDNGRPPSRASLDWSQVYSAKDRIQLRESIAQTLHQWVGHL